MTRLKKYTAENLYSILKSCAVQMYTALACYIFGTIVLQERI